MSAISESVSASTIKAPSGVSIADEKMRGRLRPHAPVVVFFDLHAPLFDGAAGDGAIVEGNLPVGEFLVGFVPLSRDENDVARARKFNGFPDGFGPVGNLLVPAGFEGRLAFRR